MKYASSFPSMEFHSTCYQPSSQEMLVQIFQSSCSWARKAGNLENKQVWEYDTLAQSVQHRWSIAAGAGRGGCRQGHRLQLGAKVATALLILLLLLLVLLQHILHVLLLLPVILIFLLLSSQQTFPIVLHSRPLTSDFIPIPISLFGLIFQPNMPSYRFSPLFLISDPFHPSETAPAQRREDQRKVFVQLCGSHLSPPWGGWVGEILRMETTKMSTSPLRPLWRGWVGEILPVTTRMSTSSIPGWMLGTP